MDYKYESELVNCFIKFYQRQFLNENSSGWDIKKEQTVGKNIADIVIIKTKTPSKILPKKNLTVKESVILSFIRQKGPVPFAILSDQQKLSSKDVIRKYLQRLFSWGMVNTTKNGLINYTSEWIENFEIVAIEAKLTKWKQALMQAQNYKKYADKSYVALPKNTSLNSDEIDQFKKAGVGLFSVGDNKINQIIPPENSQNFCWRREYINSRLISNLHSSTN